MKKLNSRIAGWFAAGLTGLVMLAQPGRLVAQTANIHGHVQNAVGQPVTQGEVKLTTDKNPTTASTKFEYTFPLDGSGNYKGTVDKPGNYWAVLTSQGKTVDWMPAVLAAGDDKTVDIDMTRPEYLAKMSPADKEALEEYKKQNAKVSAENAKIENLNKVLAQARVDTKAGNFDAAIKSMTDATTAKPDEAILWDTLGDAQLGLANVSYKAAHDNHTTDPTMNDKFNAAIASYQKALTVDAASGKPKLDLEAAANNELAEALGRIGKMSDAAAAYDAAAKADPTKAGMYYFNEAATFFNAGTDMDATAAAADKAIAADPTKADAYYIKAEALAPKITTTPDGKTYIAPPGFTEACNKYLQLAPTGAHAGDMKDLLTTIGQQIDTSYKAAPAKKGK